jgi:AcrR family transcriptional regulator
MDRAARQDVIMSQAGQDWPPVLRAARGRTRAEITRQILDTARRHLAIEGASGPSLRAIAFEPGGSSPAVYRYLASRDELPTTLIVAACCTAPRAAIAPAARVSHVLLGILAAAERLTPAMTGDDVPPGDRKALAPARSVVSPEVPDALLQRGLMAWAALFGTVSFELLGQLHGIVGEQPGDREAFFAESVRRWAEQVCIAPGHSDTAPDARQLKPDGQHTWSSIPGPPKTAPALLRKKRAHELSPSRRSQGTTGRGDTTGRPGGRLPRLAP